MSENDTYTNHLYMQMIHMLNTFHCLLFPSLFMCVFDHIALFYIIL